MSFPCSPGLLDNIHEAQKAMRLHFNGHLEPDLKVGPADVEVLANARCSLEEFDAKVKAAIASSRPYFATRGHYDTWRMTEVENMGLTAGTMLQAGYVIGSGHNRSILDHNGQEHFLEVRKPIRPQSIDRCEWYIGIDRGMELLRNFVQAGMLSDGEASRGLVGMRAEAIRPSAWDLHLDTVPLRLESNTVKHVRPGQDQSQPRDTIPEVMRALIDHRAWGSAMRNQERVNLLTVDVVNNGKLYGDGFIRWDKLPRLAAIPRLSESADPFFHRPEEVKTWAGYLGKEGMLPDGAIRIDIVNAERCDHRDLLPPEQAEWTWLVRKIYPKADP